MTAKLRDGAPLKVEMLDVSGMIVHGHRRKPFRLTGWNVEKQAYATECACETCEAARKLGLANNDFACASVST